MSGLRSGLYFVVGIAALAAGCGGAVADGLTGEGNPEPDGSGGTSSSDDGNTDGTDDDSGNTGGTDDEGNTDGTGNTGNTGGAGNTGNTGNCDPSQCESASILGQPLAACCPPGGGGCGLDVSPTAQYTGITGCIERDQPGKQDPSCPSESIETGYGAPLQLSGCCRPTGECGYLVNIPMAPSFGCVDPAQANNGQPVPVQSCNP